MSTEPNVRRRFVLEGFEAALERKKREHPPIAPILDGEKEARLIQIACSQPPEGCAKWTLQLLADELVALDVV
ncbi:MAG: Homeodomain-like domain-containing protein, partial [Candidatus Kentron sp. G]